jgi:hypothetical protein
MPGYRLYFLDVRGHIGHAREFIADDDLDAIENAQHFAELAPMELWCRHRKIHHWGPVQTSVAGT